MLFFLRVKTEQKIGIKMKLCKTQREESNKENNTKKRERRDESKSTLSGAGDGDPLLTIADIRHAKVDVVDVCCCNL